ncbi:XapX domain protein [Variovorax sp. PBL-H6]|uniref:XapX domain-containing protein n=1 Tax=Variovorax sp. PBL-H6 TaxID=434009 RepID=UPI001316BDC3|nr:XapX domain-containing protein [Variovorax sp. PBL-H6]VTU17909.1 XapX domain protein [Variovorax sp. PBL-H6]
MKPYVLSLALGLLVGVIYALFQVRSPAPPVIALVGLFGILLGEQIPPLIKSAFKTESTATSWLRHQVKPHVFGELPQCAKADPAATPAKPT